MRTSVPAAARRAVAAVVAAVLIAGCGGGGGGDRPDSEQVLAVATDYAHAFGGGDGNKACSLLTPAGRAALVQRVSSVVATHDCAEAVQRLQSLAGPNVNGPLQTAKASSPTVTGDKATVTLTAAGHAAQVALEKVDGNWLLTRAPGL
jgi:hypothetical protein